MTSTWIWLAVFTLLFAVGLGVTLGGLLVVVRALTSRPKPPLVTAATPPPSQPTLAPTLAPLRPDALAPGAAPAEEWEDEVPTAVFRASDYKDIEALMQDADKYVSKHKND